MSSPQNGFQYDVFISHAREDSAWSEELANRLKSAGLRVWLDAWYVKPGMSLTEVINQGLEKSWRFVPVMTKVYFSKNWAQKELKYAMNKDADDPEKFVIPILLKTCTVPPLLKDTVLIDFRKEADFEKNCAALIQTLRETSVVQQPPPKSSEPTRLQGSVSADPGAASKVPKLSQAGHSVAPVVEKHEEPTSPKQEQSKSENEQEDKSTPPPVKSLSTDSKDKNEKPAEPTEPRTKNGGTDKGTTPLLNEVPTDSKDKNKKPALSKEAKWLIGIGIATLLLTAIGIIWQNHKPTQPKFAITKNFLSLRDTIRIEQTQGEIRKEQLDVRFDSTIFYGAAKFINKDKGTLWNFIPMEFKEIKDPRSFFRNGPHKMEVRYPNQDWSETFKLTFNNSDSDSTTHKQPNHGTEATPQFRIENPYRHPDSTIMIWSKNEDENQTKISLIVKFDEIELHTRLVSERDTIGQTYWKFNLNDFNARKQPSLRLPGTHHIQLRFESTEWSEKKPIVFDPEPLPLPKFVTVRIKFGGENVTQRQKYALQMQHILSYINGRTANQIQQESNLQGHISDNAWKDLTGLLQDYRIDVVQNPCMPYLSKSNQLYEVRGVPISLFSPNKGDNLWPVFSFNQENPPKLLRVGCDQLAYWFHLTQDQTPLAPGSPEYNRLSNFFANIERWYNRRDIESLKAAFVDTAEIVVARATSDNVEYFTRDKKSYFDILQSIFEREAFLRVEFRNFKFRRVQDSKAFRYFVEYSQKWDSSSYSDYGTIFMLVESSPQNGSIIINRSWEPTQNSIEHMHSNITPLR